MIEGLGGTVFLMEPVGYELVGVVYGLIKSIYGENGSYRCTNYTI